jgi:hypothetical protein
MFKERLGGEGNAFGTVFFFLQKNDVEMLAPSLIIEALSPLTVSQNFIKI